MSSVIPSHDSFFHGHKFQNRDNGGEQKKVMKAKQSKATRVKWWRQMETEPLGLKPQRRDMKSTEMKMDSPSRLCLMRNYMQELFKFINEREYM